MSSRVSLGTCVTAHELVQLAKEDLNIATNISVLDEDDIRNICKWVGIRAPDTTQDEDNVYVLGKLGIEIMLFIALSMFPRFYEKYELSQPH